MSAAPLSPRRGRPSRRIFFDPVTSPNALELNQGDLSLTLLRPGADVQRTLNIVEQFLKFAPSEATTPSPDTVGNRESDGREEKSRAGATADEKAAVAVEPIAAPAPKHDVREFLAECCDFVYQAYVPIADFTAAYRAWCRAGGETPRRQGERALLAAALEAGGRCNRSRRINGKQRRTVDGLRLKSSAGQLQLSIVPAEGLALA